MQRIIPHCINWFTPNTDYFAMVRLAIANANGVVNWVKTKAIGQAVSACQGQAKSHSMVSPTINSGIVPDIKTAIMKVVSPPLVFKPSLVAAAILSRERLTD